MTLTEAPHARPTDAWARRRADRERDLATPHGWLSLTAYHWLPARPAPLPGVPGLWLADDDGAHLRPAASHGDAQGGDDTAVVHGPEVVGGVFDGDVAEGGSRVLGTFLPAGREPARTPGPLDGATRAGGKDRADDADDTDETAEVAVELVRRTGRLAIRLRDPHARARLDFAGVPVFDHDPSWDLDAPVRLFAEPRGLVVGAARPGLVHRVQAVGELDLTRGDRTVTLLLTAGRGGDPTLVFSDEAPGVAPWRVASARLPVGLAAGGDGVARLDLNAAVNLPYAFSDHGTCPAPAPGNHVPFAVTAGEKAPR